VIKSKTVFVVGAGASKEVGLPTGDELKQRITKLLAPETRDEFITQALVVAAGKGDYSRYSSAAVQLSKAMTLAQSVDNYMEAHQEDPAIQVCGKLAIVKSILEAERRSTLHQDRGHSIAFDAVSKTWFGYFFKMIAEACVRENANTLLDNVSMIIFNYDRCIEQFLFHAIRTYYSLSDDDAHIIASRMIRFHPYGTVAAWRDSGDHHPFGSPSADANHLLSLSHRIRTYSERTADVKNVAEMQSFVADAEFMVFLGFAFHPLNMQLISPPDGKSKVRRVFGTIYGMSDSDAGVIEDQIFRMVPGSPVRGRGSSGVTLLNGTCADLFQQFGRELAQR
jgi:hypothetical protein